MSTSTTPDTTAATTNRGRFVWHELLTTDTSAAQEFYKTVVGWSTMDSSMPGMEYTLFTAGETPVAGLMTLPKAAVDMGAPPAWLAYVEVPDIEATVTQAQGLGAKLLMPAMTVEGVGRFAVLQDAQGATFAVITSAGALQPEGDPAPREFSWHELSTSDQAAGISFYETLFGWEKKSEFDMGDMGVYHMFGRDRFTYGGMMTRAPGMPASYWLHYVRVADSADAAVERATKAGAKVMVGPMEVPGGDRVAILSDPQGAAFAVHSKP